MVRGTLLVAAMALASPAAADKTVLKCDVRSATGDTLSLMFVVESKLVPDRLTPALMIGNQGANDVVAMLRSGHLIIVETPGAGLVVTSIHLQGPTPHAVHSRNMLFAEKRLVSQFQGPCEVR